MKIGLGADHGGFRLKDEIKNYLDKKGYETVDYGTNSKESVDYPDYAQKVSEAILRGEVDKAVLVCGTGIGVCIAANKVEGIRCASVSDTFSAKMCRAHNDCQIMALGERTIGVSLAFELVDAFLTTEFEGERHERRVNKINALDKREARFIQIGKMV